ADCDRVLERGSGGCGSVEWRGGSGRMLVLARGDGWAEFLYGTVRPLQLRGGSVYARHYDSGTQRHHPLHGEQRVPANGGNSVDSGAPKGSVVCGVCASREWQTDGE